MPNPRREVALFHDLSTLSVAVSTRAIEWGGSRLRDALEDWCLLMARTSTSRARKSTRAVAARGLAALCAAVLFLWTLPASARDDTSGSTGAESATTAKQEAVDLEWVRLEGAEQCPPKSAFEAALVKRLGRVYFSERASRVLTVTLSNEKGPFRVVLALKERGSDALASKQELFSYSSQCDEVFGATVLSVALLLNPEEMSEPSNAEELETEDSDFFAPPTAEVGLGVPVEASDTPAEVPPEPQVYDIPVAARPWARTHGAATLAFALGLEQLPSAAPGFAARTEWPIAPAWLLWLSADWLQTGPTPEVGTGVTLTQTSGWVGAAWLPYAEERLEVHLLGGLGARQLTATLTASSPQVHVALQLGAGLVLKVTEMLALDGRATAAVPFQSAGFGPRWTQTAIGGQLQIGVTVGIPNPTGSN